MLEVLHEKRVLMHLELSKNDLVCWIDGNASARDPETGVVGQTTDEVLQ